MVHISVPNNNHAEREYIINFVFKEILGIDYNLKFMDQDCYKISINNRTITLKDSFFNNHPEILSYLNSTSLPNHVEFISNEFLTENDIPVIYGTNELIILDHNIFCGIDIFATCYFMLTRWEEHVNPLRDEHNRFPATESIAYKNNFLHRPIVNEYIEMLWNMIKKTGYEGKRKSREFKLVLTHDVDAIKYTSWKSVIGDFVKRKDLKLAQHNLTYLLGKDPFNTFDFLMTKSENLGVQSRFYFLSKGSYKDFDTVDYLKQIRFKSVINQIKKRGHIIGFHPGYYSFNDPIRWRREKTLLEDSIKQPVYEGRQHYLRMDISKTLPIWNTFNMEIDSTLGYHDKEGYRCGTGDLFNVFDFLKRNILSLKERPLIIMDGTLRQYQKYTLEEANQKIHYYLSVAQKYKSTITLLFHNSSFSGDWDGYKNIYSNIL